MNAMMKLSCLVQGPVFSALLLASLPGCGGAAENLPPPPSGPAATAGSADGLGYLRDACSNQQNPNRAASCEELARRAWFAGQGHAASADGLGSLRDGCFNQESANRGASCGELANQTRDDAELARIGALCEQGVTDSHGIDKTGMVCGGVVVGYDKRAYSADYKVINKDAEARSNHYSEVACRAGQVNLCKSGQEADRQRQALQERNAPGVQAAYAERQARDAQWQADQQAHDQSVNAVVSGINGVRAQIAPGSAGASASSPRNGSGGANSAACGGCKSAPQQAACANGSQAACYLAAAWLCQCNLNAGGCGSTPAALQQCISQNQASAASLNSNAPSVHP